MGFYNLSNVVGLSVRSLRNLWRQSKSDDIIREAKHIAA
jgi:hypothetical protein